MSLLSFGSIKKEGMKESEGKRGRQYRFHSFVDCIEIHELNETHVEINSKQQQQRQRKMHATQPTIN